MYEPKINAYTRITNIDRRKRGGADHGFLHGKWICQKWGNIDVAVPDLAPPCEELIIVEGNLFMYGGVSCLWESLIGNGTTTAGQALTFFSNTQAAIGVGDSSTAAAATQTDLQGATYTTDKLRAGMVATYPIHGDGVTSAANTISFQSTFTTGQANFAWNECAIFNSTTAATGRMFNRLVQSFGSKSSGSWSLTIQASIT